MSALKIVLGIVLIVGGVAIAILAITADVTMIAGGGDIGFGYKQIAALIFGIIALIAGLVVLYLGIRGETQDEDY